MALDLSGCFAKIERAKKHIGEFNTEKIYFLGSDPYVVITKFNPESDATESIMGPMPNIPASMAAIVGDAIQNLRSALDYMAAELVISAGNDPKRIYFPICETSEKYVAESEGKTKGMPPEAKKLIDLIEPYEGGHGNDLWYLHALNNTDKHRLLMSVSGNVAQQVMLSLSPEGNRFTTLVSCPGLNEGDILGSVSGNSEGQQRIQFTFDIAFSQPDSIAGEPVLQTLEYLAHMVETIVRDFKARF
jgi:hypothetical protein